LQKDKTELTKNIGNNNSTKSNRISSTTTIANAASITRAISYTDHDIAAAIRQKQEVQRKQLILEGVDIILSLYVAAGQQRIFPRTIMTRCTKGQSSSIAKSRSYTGLKLQIIKIVESMPIQHFYQRQKNTITTFMENNH
jgi:hypothetical protein